LLCKSTNSANTESWLDEHADDELADLVFAVENPTGYDFSMEQRFWNLLSVAGWYAEQEKQDGAEEWIGRARDFVNGLDEKPTQADLLLKLATQLRRWNQRTLALDVINDAAKLAPEEASVHSERAYILSALDRREQALAEYETAVDLDPTNSRRKADRGAALCHLDQCREALVELDAVLEEDPDSVYAWQWKAETLRKLRRFDEALVAIDEAIKRADKRSDLWKDRGLILDEAGRFAEAVDAYTKGIELDPDDFSCLNNRAVSLYAMGRYDEALESATECLRLRPSDAVPNFTRVEILLSSGQWEKGWAEAEKCLQQFPPQTPRVESERYFIQIIFRSTQQQGLWKERIAKLCDLFERVQAISYVGDGLVRTLRSLEDDQVARELLDRWHAAWHAIGGGYDELRFSLRLFDAGIEYLKTREPNALLDLPVEQRAILEQLFDIDVAHED